MQYPKRPVGGLCLTLLLTALPLASPLAQDAAAQPPPPPAEEAPDATDADAGPAAASGQDDSAFDYEASEQISEDLSVSFPVDI
jgi:hypothetical protein